MHRYQTPDSIFAAYLLLNPSGPVLLLEGDEEDDVLWDHFHEAVTPIICGGKTNVLNAARIFEGQSKRGVYGLVDRDFDTQRGKEAFYPASVIRTEKYDLVSDLVAAAPQGLRRVLLAQSARVVRDIEAATSRPASELVHELASRLAPIRLTALQLHLPLKCQGFDFARMLGSGFTVAPLSAYLQSITCSDPRYHLPAALPAVQQAQRITQSDSAFVGGHDLIAAGVAVMKLGGLASVSRKAVYTGILSLAQCNVLSVLLCIKRLNAMAVRDFGHPAFKCGL